MFNYEDPNDKRSVDEGSEQNGDAISDDQLDEAIGAGEYWGGDSSSDGV